jgi:colanic acid biosynthesis glycosyl transferase WcaI
LLHLASFALSSLPLMLLLALWRPAAVFAVTPALFAAPWGRLTAWLAGAASWLHVQDFEVDAAFELGLLQGGAARRSVLAVERRIMASYDHVSTISRRMLKQLVAKGVPLERAELLPNGVDVRSIHPQGGASPLRASLGMSQEQIVCLYSGTMNRKQGLQVVIDTARRLDHRPEIVFVLSGNGEFREPLEAAAAGLRNVRFLDLCGAEHLNDLLNAADIHLLPQLRGAQDLVMPSKLSAMLASGRPTIAAAARGTEIAAVVEGRGIVVQPESVDAFVAAVEQLAADTPERLRLGRAARSHAEEAFDNEAIYDLLDDKLNRATAPLPAGLPVRQKLRI